MVALFPYEEKRNQRSKCYAQQDQWPPKVEYYNVCTTKMVIRKEAVTQTVLTAALKQALLFHRGGEPCWSCGPGLQCQLFTPGLFTPCRGSVCLDTPMQPAKWIPLSFVPCDQSSMEAKTPLSRRKAPCCLRGLEGITHPGAKVTSAGCDSYIISSAMRSLPVNSL